MGNAEALYHRLVGGGESEIDRFIEDRQREEYFVDFKRSSGDGVGNRLHDSDLKHLRTALSGFSNSEGGVLVWGVDCRGGGGKADVARGKFPIEDPARFAAWLDGNVAGSTIPSLTKVESHVIVSEIAPNHGFVATLIPKSSRPPHQAVGELLYYVRSGSSFVRAYHSQIADMFNRKASHKLEYRLRMVDVSATQPPRPISSYTFELGVYNHGPRVARDFYGKATSNWMDGLSDSIVTCTGKEGAVPVHRDSTDTYTFYTREGVRIVPSTELTICRISICISPNHQRPLLLDLLFGQEETRYYVHPVVLQPEDLTQLWSGATSAAEYDRLARDKGKLLGAMAAALQLRNYPEPEPN